MKLFIIIISAAALIIFYGCDSASNADSPNLQIIQQEKDTIHVSTIDSGNNIDSNDSTESTNTIALFIEKIEDRFYENKIRVPYNRLNNRTAKHVFIYDDEFMAIDVNVDGISYLSIYECGFDDTLIRYVKVVPEMEMEGSFINYYNDPVHEFHFENDRLINIGFKDSENNKHTNPYLDIPEERKVHIEDSVMTIVDNFLRVDESTNHFSGNWNYLGNNDQYSFSTELNQSGSFVYGGYCAYTSNKYDCQNEDQGGSPCWVKGYSYTDTLYVFYKSCYADQQGNAMLYYQNDSLVWETVYAPDGSIVLDKGIIKEVAK